jgi:hypothetical protein
MHDAGRHLWAQQRAREWGDRHASEMSLVLALQTAGYSRDESRRMAARHMAGEPIEPSRLGHNGGPALTD